MFNSKKRNEDPRKSESHIEGGRRQGENNNPYVSARRTWNSHTGAIVASRQTWQIIGVLSLLIALTAVGGVIKFASDSTYIPYVIEVDKFGHSSAIGPVNKSNASAADMMKTILAANANDFIVDSRTVTPDVALQNKAIHKVYAKLSPRDPATMKIQDWYQGSEDSDPFKRAQTEMVEVKIETTLQQTKDTWQVDWIEIVRNRDGVKEGLPIKYRGLLTIYQAERTSDTTEEEILKNPFGIYVRDFSWSRLL